MERAYGPILSAETRDVVGVRLDCDAGTLSIFVDGYAYSEHRLTDYGPAFSEESHRNAAHRPASPARPRLLAQRILSYLCAPILVAPSLCTCAGDMDCSGGGRYAGAAAAGDAGLMPAHQNRGVMRSQHALPPGLVGGGVGPGRAADGSGRVLTSHATSLCQVSPAKRHYGA